MYGVVGGPGRDCESFVSADTKVTFTGYESGLCSFKYGDAY